MLTPGTRLGGYQVLGKIGEGGMGEVYLARDGLLDRDVALKILPELARSRRLPQLRQPSPSHSPASLPPALWLSLDA